MKITKLVVTYFDGTPTQTVSDWEQMEIYAGGYLSHNLMLIAFNMYWKRLPSLQAYVAHLDWMVNGEPDGMNMGHIR